MSYATSIARRASGLSNINSCNQWYVPSQYARFVARAPALAGGYLLWPAAMLAAVKGRVDGSGPYKTAGDAFAGSPGDWTTITTQANACVSAGNEAIAAAAYQGDNPVTYATYGLRAMCAAFVYLVNPTAATYTMAQYRDAAKASVLAQVARPENDMRYICFRDSANTHLDSSIHQWQWLMRLLITYDAVRADMTTAEREAVERFIRNMGDLALSWYDYTYRSAVFPARDRDNYAAAGGHAVLAGAARFITPTRYSFVDATPALQDQINFLSSMWNNRTGLQATFVGLAGILLHEPAFIASSHRFFQEWLAYSVFSSGALGEYNRSAPGANGSTVQGVTYGSYIISGMATVAEAMRRHRSDTSLASYSTTVGMAGTEGGAAKTLKLAMDTHLSLVARTLDRWFAAENTAAGSQVRDNTTHQGQITFSGTTRVHHWSYLPSKDLYTALADATFSTKIDNVVKHNTGAYAAMPAFPTGSIDGGNTHSTAGSLGIWPGVFLMFG